MILCEDYQCQETESPLRINGIADARAVVGEAFAKGLKPPPPVDLNKWAVENIVFGKESPFPGRYDPDLFPFFAEILTCLEPQHPAKNVTVRGSAQIGKTVLASVFIGGTQDMDPGPMLYMHPTLDNAEDWVLTKWKPFVQNCERLRKLFPWSNRTRETTNKLLYKERIDGQGYLMVSGANSPSSLSMRSFPRQIQDDLAKWKDNDAGDPETQADSRSQAFPWGKVFKISTPYVLGNCRITDNFKNSDQRFYHVPCPHCGHEHPLEWENLKESLDAIEVKSKANPDDPVPYHEAHFTCPDCGGVIEHHHKEAMVAAGRWVKHNPKSSDPGFHIWSAYVPIYDWAWIAKEYFKAKGDPEKEQSFMNDKVGELYEEKGEAPPWEDIKARALSSTYHRGQIPEGAILLTAGVDVQGNRIEWLVKGFGSGLRRWTIDHGVIDAHITEADAWKQLDELLKRKWRNVFGRDFTLDMLAIDANYETDEVHNWAKRHPHSRVITVRGSNNFTAPALALVNYDRKNSGKIKKRQKRFYNVGVSLLKASLYKHLEKTDPFERGYCGFPNDLEENYFQQLCSETRMTEKDKKGRDVVFWKCLPNVRNEILDCENYAEAAARRIGWHSMTEDAWERLIDARESPPVDAQADLFEPQRTISEQAAATKPPEAPAGKSLADMLA